MAIKGWTEKSEFDGMEFCRRMQELGVKKATLEKYGAVSEQTAREMAAGIRRVSGADIGISTTGIAGPTGGSELKPVGTVYIGVSTISKNYVLLANLATKSETDDKKEKNVVNSHDKINFIHDKKFFRVARKVFSVHENGLQEA